MVVGTVCAAAGLFWGKVALRVNPIDTRTTIWISSIRTSFSSPAGPSNPPTLPALARAWSSRSCQCRVAGSAPEAESTTCPAYVHLATDSLDSGRRRCASDVDSRRSRPGRRIWMEAVRKGHVVGVMEARTECDGVPASALSELARPFPDARPHDPVVADRSFPRFRRRPHAVSEARALLRTIDSLLAQDYPDFEVIVVDNRHEYGRDLCLHSRSTRRCVW